jgi:hypothetical protein
VPAGDHSENIALRGVPLIQPSLARRIKQAIPRIPPQAAQDVPDSIGKA